MFLEMILSKEMFLEQFKETLSNPHVVAICAKYFRIVLTQGNGNNCIFLKNA
jgi:hypothetical protein